MFRVVHNSGREHAVVLSRMYEDVTVHDIHESTVIDDRYIKRMQLTEDGRCHSQVNDESIEQKIAYDSRTLNLAERNYNTTELKLLVKVLACERFRACV